MARLSVCLLGSFEVTLDGHPVAGWRSDKVRALLAYLAVKAQGPHRREKLAGLLWPEGSERAARANLRAALANLRQVIADRQASPPFLHISRQTIRLNLDGDVWLDVNAFTDLLETQGAAPPTLSQLEEAVELYRGDLVEGFSLAGSAAFEEWLLLQRERLQRLALAGLRRIVEHHQQRGDHERALRFAWRQLELEPWREDAQRQLMRLLALTGQRGAALAQYETCRRLLAQELGVEPAAETTQLYEQIRDGEIAPRIRVRTSAQVHAPTSFLTASETTLSERAVFVARERELSSLRRFLDLSLSGRGRVAFVVGEAGTGKTSLVREFARRAQETHADLLVASGNCSAHSGVGDPYLPFRDVLAMLSGDVEARLSAGAIGTEQARRLWSALPLTVQALLEDGPDLIDTFVPGRAVLARAEAWAHSSAPIASDWLDPLRELVHRRASAGRTPGPVQSDLFAQYSRVLLRLASSRPLLIWLDDLQWADRGSLSLFFQLRQWLQGQQILLVGAYRSEDIELGRDGERHPLDPVVLGFQRQFGEVTVSLAQAKGRAFVEALLATEPNRLDASFSDLLFRQTQGHALFTIELLRGLQERRDLVRDADGCWVQGASLDWQTLPPRVEAVVAERIARLPEALQETLRVASVEGEVFTAEAIARASETDEAEVLRQCTGALNRRHRLVAASALTRLGDRWLSRYRFRHILFQRYLYNSLDEVERARLHAKIGNVLELEYQERLAAGEALTFGAQFPAVSDGAGQLARHFQAAGIAEKAVRYRLHAGIRAYLLSADTEAIAHFQQGLALLETVPRSSERDEQELTLLLAYLHPLQAARPAADTEVVRVFARIDALGREMADVPLLLLNGMLWMLYTYHHNRAEYDQALELARRLLNLAPRAEDPLFVASAHVSLGQVFTLLGEFTVARKHLAHLIGFGDRERLGATGSIDLQNLYRALTSDSWALWCLGFPDQALERSQQAQDLELPFYPQFFGVSAGGVELRLLRRETEAARSQLQAVANSVSEKGRALERAIGQFYSGRLQVETGRIGKGIQRMLDTVEVIQVTGMRHGWSQHAAFLVSAYLQAGRPEEGLGAVSEALAFVEETGERFYEAELRRLQGDLFLLQGDEPAAEDSFHQAIELAREQNAKSWELRATTSLSRLLVAQGRAHEARGQLSEIYGWFTEGLNTADLQDAQALLAQLSTDGPA